MFLFTKREKKGEEKRQIYLNNLLRLVSNFTVQIREEKLVSSTLIHQWILIALQPRGTFPARALPELSLSHSSSSFRAKSLKNHLKSVNIVAF